MFDWLRREKKESTAQTSRQAEPRAPQKSLPPKRTISQHTVSQMIAEYKRLFHEAGPFRALGPPLNINELRNFLFGMNFPREFLEKCEYSYYWDFASLFPALHDGSFYFKDRQPSPAWAQEQGQLMLQGFATALCGILAHQPELVLPNSRYFMQSLLRDGFQFIGSRLVETNQNIIEEARELSAVESLIRLSVHDNQKLLLHHFVNGRELFDLGPYHACVSEWRSFLEEILRGVWRLTRTHRPNFAKFAERPSMKDLFEFLEKAGFLDADEKLAFSSAWGFLSAGGHPGISDRDSAHLSMILALTFGHATLLKLQRWDEGAFTHF